MGWGSGNLGGGSGGLNFKIVGGTSEPSNPKENMIWVNTDAKITSWIFSATEPTEPVEGMVWITVGTSSVVEFNALKKNVIQICPVGAKQFVSGAWVDRTAKIYQRSAWLDWDVYLIRNGIEMVNFGLHTGINSYAVVMEKSRQGDSIIYELSSEANGYGAYGVYYTDVDLTNINTIEINASVSFTVANGTCKLAVLSKLPSDTNAASFDSVTVASVGITSASKETVTLDVSSLTGVHPVGLYFIIQFPATLTVSDFRCT